MRSKFLILLTLGLFLTALPAHASAERSTAKKKKPMTEEHIGSGAFRKLQQITRMDPLELHILYETSGAQDFGEFASALMVAWILRLDQQLVLRALHKQKLNRVLHDFGVSPKQAKQAIKLAKKELKRTDKPAIKYR